MKKLAITQIVLGVLIIGSYFVFIMFVTPGYFRQEIIDAEGNVIGFVSGLHKPNVLLGIWTLVHPALGLAVFGCGIAQLIQARLRSTGTVLTIAQITLGALILFSLAVFIIWAEPNWQPMPIDLEFAGSQAVLIRHNPKWVMLLITWKVASFILGLSVAGCGATQSIKREGKRQYQSGVRVKLAPMNPRTTT